MIYSIWTGLVLGILSVCQMAKVYRQQYPSIHEIFFIFPVIWLNALGIYIGRYMRFNSWDVITDSLSLFREISIMVFQPFEHMITWGMICCFAVFMTIYLLFREKNIPGYVTPEHYLKLVECWFYLPRT